MQVLKDAASASIYGSSCIEWCHYYYHEKRKESYKVKVDFSPTLTAQFYSNQSHMQLCNSIYYATVMAQAALNDGSTQ